MEEKDYLCDIYVIDKDCFICSSRVFKNFSYVH